MATDRSLKVELPGSKEADRTLVSVACQKPPLPPTSPDPAAAQLSPPASFAAPSPAVLGFFLTSWRTSSLLGSGNSEAEHNLCRHC